MKYFYGHLGMGDHLLCNAIVRRLAKDDDIIVACWSYNEKSVQFMFRDLPNVATRVVHSEDEAREFNDISSIKLGWGGNHKDFNPDIFDQEFYRQSSVPFEARWDEFKVNRDPMVEAKCNVPFRFVHDDWGRGFQISRIKDSMDVPIVRPHSLPNIFQFCWMLEHAEEIHCINSSFLILADSIPTLAKRLVFHWYARKTHHPKLRKNWEIIE